MKLIISGVELNGKRRVKVALESGMFYTGEFKGHHDYVRASKRLKIDEAEVHSAVAKFLETGKDDPLEVTSSSLTKPALNSYLVRGELGSSAGKSSKSETYQTFAEAFTAAKAGQVIEWQDKNVTCCLDIDLTKVVDIERILSLFSTVTPAPMHFWASQSGQGLHAIYEITPPYTADELAAIAGFRFLTIEPTAKIELLARTRTPPGGKNKKDVSTTIYGNGSQSVDFTLDSLLYSQADGNDLAQMVCDMYDYEIGKRYPHTMCPVVPSVRASANADPVVVHEDHVYCFVCAADHMFSGSRVPGNFPFSALAGLSRETNIKLCIKNFVHWGHAQYSFTGNYKYDKLLFRALLKAEHGNDPRIPVAIRAGEPIGIVRYAGMWADYTGTILDVKSTSARIAELPVAQRVCQETGKITIDRSKAEWLSSNSDLSSFGYKSVMPIHGFHMTQLQELPDSKIFAVITSRSLTSNKQPRFLAGKDRMKLSSAWEILNSVVPGVKTDLITALLIARGCSEHRSGLLPMLFLTGVTGSGKSSHVELAAAIFGDSVANITIGRDKDRFFNEIVTGKQRSGFMFFDEFFKNARLARLDDVEAMQSLLNFNKSEMVYMIYKGAIPLGNMPALLWADTEIPDEVLMHEQIGRRMFHYRLTSRLDWEKSLSDNSILEPSNLRSHGNDRLIHACNTILSDTLESYFTTTSTDFKIIETLGIKKLQDGELMARANIAIFNLFKDVCKATDRKASMIDTRQGFRLLDPPELLLSLQTVMERGTSKCRILSANDLQNILRLKCPCKVEIELKSNKYYIRFVSYDGKLTNEQLCKNPINSKR